MTDLFATFQRYMAQMFEVGEHTQVAKWSCCAGSQCSQCLRIHVWLLEVVELVTVHGCEEKLFRIVSFETEMKGRDSVHDSAQNRA